MKKKTQIDYAKKMYSRYLNIKIVSLFLDIIFAIGYLILLFKTDDSTKMLMFCMLIFGCSLFTIGTIIASKKCKKIEKDIKNMQKKEK